MHHPVAERRRRDQPPLGIANLEGDVAARPPRTCPQLALEAQNLGLEVGEERGRSRRPSALPVTARSAAAHNASNVCNTTEQIVSPAPPHAPSASRRPIGRSRRASAPRARSGARPGVRGPWPDGTGTAASRSRDSPPSGAGAGRACTSPRPDAPARPAPSPADGRPAGTSAAEGTAQPVGTSHSTKPYIDSTAGPRPERSPLVSCRRSDHRDRWGLRPPDPQEVKIRRLKS